MSVDEFIIGPKPKYFYYLLKGSSLKRGGGRSQRPEAGRLVKVGWGAFHFSFPSSCRGTGKRFIED
jgi:hypothetical protein